MENVLMKKAIVGDQEYDLPEGVESISDDGLYLVDFNAIELAAEPTEEKEFRFFNPRHLGEYKIDENSLYLGNGFEKESMKELLSDIQDKGLDYPLIVRWILKDGKVKVQVNDGERRYRCIERLLIKNEKVWSEKDNAFSPASKVYGKIICRIKAMNDEEALERACAVSETSVRWGDAATAKLIKKLYELGLSDEKVCKLVKKGKQWVAEQYSLNELDEVCFNYLQSNKINRSVALTLARVANVDERQTRCMAAYRDAVMKREKLVEKLDKSVEKAEDKEELAQAQLVEAQLKGEDVVEQEKVVEEAIRNTKKKKEAKAASAKPMAKTKNLRKASGETNAPLRPSKIKKQHKVIQSLIEKNDETHCNLGILQTLEVVYKSILSGEEDILKILKKI